MLSRKLPKGNYSQLESIVLSSALKNKSGSSLLDFPTKSTLGLRSKNERTHFLFHRQFLNTKEYAK